MNYVLSFNFTILSSSFYIPESLGQVQSYRFVRHDLSGCQSALQQPCQIGWQREMGGLRRAFLGYYLQQGKCESLYASAQDLIAVFPKNEQYKALVKMSIGNLKEVITPVETLRTAMKGVGPSLSPQLTAEIGDPMRFKHREALTAFAGVDPGVNQTLNQGSNSASKTGNPWLRHTLFKIMEVLIKLHPEEDKVYQFMDKKRSEGKPYFVYMTTEANKFLRICYGKTREYLHTLKAAKETNK